MGRTALIVAAGVNRWSLGAAVVTSLLTTISVLAFGGQRPDAAPPPQGGRHR